MWGKGLDFLIFAAIFSDIHHSFSIYTLQEQYRCKLVYWKRVHNEINPIFFRTVAALILTNFYIFLLTSLLMMSPNLYFMVLSFNEVASRRDIQVLACRSGNKKRGFYNGRKMFNNFKYIYI